jgi:hypothetical protein
MWAMQGTHDIDEPSSAHDGDTLDPREAARLLTKTERDAKHQFDLSPPLLTVFMGVVILAGYAVLWLSVRGQHPYKGPSGGAIALVYAAVAVAIALTVKVYRRTTAGVSGPNKRQQQVEGVAILISFIGSPILQGALRHYGASDALVYGVIPAAAPLIIVGTTVLGVAGSKEDWPQFGAALMVVIGGMIAAFVGPIDAWLVAGIALFIGVATHAALTAKVVPGIQHG